MRSLSLLILICLPLAFSAQYTDIGGWYFIKGSKDIVKHWKLSAEGDLRMDHQFGNLETAFVDLTVENSPTKIFEWAVNYRFGNSYESRSMYSLRHRWSVDAGIKTELAKFDIKARLRYQWAQSDIQVNDLYHPWSQQLRTKLSASHKVFKRTFLEVSGEVWWSMSTGHYGQPTDFRISTGLERRVGKRNYVSLSAIWNRSFDAIVPTNEWVGALGFKRDFKGDIFKKKNKKKATDDAMIGS